MAVRAYQRKGSPAKQWPVEVETHGIRCACFLPKAPCERYPSSPIFRLNALLIASISFFWLCTDLARFRGPALTGGKVRFAFITEGNRGLMGNEKFRIVPISLQIRTAATSSRLPKDIENDYSNHSWRPEHYVQTGLETSAMALPRRAGGSRFSVNNSCRLRLKGWVGLVGEFSKYRRGSSYRIFIH